MSGFRTRHIFCCQVTWTLRTTSGVANPWALSAKAITLCEVHCLGCHLQTGIIEPFWFEDHNEQSVTINTERYVQVPSKFWAALGRRRGVVSVLQSFQQHGATPHSSNESLAWQQQRAGVTRSGHSIHRIWTPQIFICGDTLRRGCMETTPDYPWRFNFVYCIDDLI